MLRAITGTLKPEKGEVYVLDKSYKELSIKERAKYISLLSQRSEIMSGLFVYEVLEMGLYPSQKIFTIASKHNKEKIEKIAKDFDITELLYKDCGILSQGQLQLVLIARLALQNAPIILLDEPDSALDYMNRYLLFKMVKNLIIGKQSAGIVVLHDPATALQWCDRIYLMHNGKFIDDFSTKDLPINIEHAMQKIYPDIKVKKDGETQYFNCYLENKF